MTAPKRFYRTTASDARLAGVCGGLARYLNIDATLVRVLWVVLTIVSFGLGGIIAYVVFWIAAPSEEDVKGRKPPSPSRG